MGVSFDIEKQQLTFGFEQNGAAVIASQTGDDDIVELFGQYFYYGYKFSDQVNGSVRSAFIKFVYFTPTLQITPT
jgi:hypothetical protein